MGNSNIAEALRSWKTTLHTSRASTLRQQVLYLNARLHVCVCYNHTRATRTRQTFALFNPMMLKQEFIDFCVPVRYRIYREPKLLIRIALNIHKFKLGSSLDLITVKSCYRVFTCSDLFSCVHPSLWKKYVFM